MHRPAARAFIVLALIVALGVLAAPTPATGAGVDYGLRFTEEQLTRAAPVIVGARVFSVDAAWDSAVDTIYTYVTLDVTDVYKEATLEPVPERIVLKQLGGIVGEIGLAIGGQTEFDVGEEVLVFLAVRPRDRTLYTMGLWQGKWDIMRGDGGVAVARRNAGHSPEGEVLAEERQLNDLVRDVTGFAASAPAAVVDVVFVPEEAPEPTGFQALKIPLFGFSWHSVFDLVSIPVNFDKAKFPGVGKGKKQNISAFTRWNDDNKSLNVYRKGKKNKGASPGTGFRPDPGGGPSGEQSVLVQDGDPIGEVDNNGPTLAVGGAYFSNSIKIRKLGFATSGFVVFNDNAGTLNFISSAICYINVLAHELGHAGGLGHSNKNGNLMFPSINANQCAAPFPLGKDDLRFWRKMYKNKFGSP